MTSFLIMTSFATELATLSVTDERTLRTDTLLRLIYKDIIYKAISLTISLTGTVQCHSRSQAKQEIASRERREIQTRLLQIANRKSLMTYRIPPSPMTLDAPSRFSDIADLICPWTPSVTN